ncbi:hypothetical protein MMC13_007110 [Lambiella insularis]|nr:hypothetical protein [Lambiella insularis]
MPRGAKKNAHQHNSKHENGIVAPGKRIIKQKSNGHLNGSPEGRSRANTPPLPTLPASHIGSTHDNDTNGNGTNVKDTVSAGMGRDSRRKSLAEVISSDMGVAEAGKSHSGKPLDQTHRKLDVSAAKPRTLYDNTAVHLALTVLKACPLRDTLAILIFLFSLPPTFLTLTNAAFAILTFIPPSGTFSGLPTLNDFFQGYTTPLSFSTMCIVDIVGLATWLTMFRPMQSLVLDWAHAMVATTLGGGYSNRPGGADSTLLCMSLVSAAHLARYKRLVLRIMYHTWLGKWAPLVHALEKTPPASVDPGVSARPMLRNLKTLIALHIVIQGLARLIRKWVLKFNDKPPLAAGINSSDPEAVAGTQTFSEMGVVDHIHNPPNSPGDLRSKGSLQSLRDAKDKVSAGKRKKKQGNYVRSKQPLWAAFAATKATIMREYEQNQVTTNAAGSNATDAENLGSAPFVLGDGRIWVTTIHPNSFFFETSIFTCGDITAQGQGDESNWIDDNGIDRGNPFYVRINGADWTSAKIHADSQGEVDPGRGKRWAGEVYGLSPAYSYQCCFVRSEDDVVILSSTVATPSLSATEQGFSIPAPQILRYSNNISASSAVVASQPQTIRPSSPASPITTLKTSIAAYENSLDDASSQQRRIRKDGKTTSVGLKKELDVLSDRISRVGTNDKGLHNRQLQQSQHMRQADDAITSIADDLDTYSNLPVEEPLEWQDQKSMYEFERDSQSNDRTDLLQSKDLNHRDSSAVQNEALIATQKRERLQHRTAKLSDQLARLNSTRTHGDADKGRYGAGQTARFAGRHHLEAHYHDQVSSLMRNFQDTQYRARNSWQQVQAVENSFEQQSIMAIQPPARSESRPITPEGDLPGTVPLSAVTTGFRFPAFGGSDSIPSATANGQNGSARARSTSMLSGNSVYTDFDEDPAPLPMPILSRGFAKAHGEEELAPPPMPALNRGMAAVGMLTTGRNGSGSGSSSGGGGQSPAFRKGGMSYAD